MKGITYFILTGLSLLCFVSFALMVRECENLSMFQFTFLWSTMCVSALLSLILIKNMEGKI